MKVIKQKENQLLNAKNSENTTRNKTGIYNLELWLCNMEINK